MDRKIWGVLITDIVHSSSRLDLRPLLTSKLRIATIAHLDERRIKLPYAVTAGDEFQTIASQLHEIPGLVFDLRRRLRPLQLRIGIGIGQVPGRLRPPVNRLGGPAFQLARKAMEDIRTGRVHKFEVQTAFRSTDEGFDLVANLVYGLHDTLIQTLSEKQWQTIDAYLAKSRVDLAARALGINGSTASRNLKRGHFWQIEETIKSTRKIVQTFFPQMHDSVQHRKLA
jgi:hypothetical protein